jgi:hypothetical protein
MEKKSIASIENMDNTKLLRETRKAHELIGELNLFGEILEHYDSYIGSMESEHHMYKAGWMDCIKKMHELIRKEFKHPEGETNGTKKIHR